MDNTGRQRTDQAVGVADAVLAVEAVVTKQLRKAEVAFTGVKQRDIVLFSFSGVQIKQLRFQGVVESMVQGFAQAQAGVKS